ncbi:mitochondrial ribosomal death-associated protein 3-domain-containing protein [Mycena latifolia]|nr:mitochondrial ribosomal death-associated protein 3-domain-containing protein [Mycena latifolia]
MFLLGRGRRRVETLVRVGVRYRGSVRRIMPKDKIAVKKGGVERDAMGRPILPQREKSVGTFNPLSAKSLTHELFETDGIGRVELDLPVLQPRDLAPGVATRFDDEDGTAPHRVFGVPKHMLLEYRILGTPCSVTTSTTLSIIRALEESKEKTARLVLNGRPGCGKSFLLLQAAEYASASGEWIVLYIPRARRLVDGSTPYHYSLQSQTYLQPRAALETLHRLGVANQHLLELIFTTAPLVLDGGAEFPAGTQLLDVVDGVRNLEDPAHAVPALEYVLRELGEQTLFPVLIAIDDFQALAGPTMYRDPRFHMIRPHHLSMPRLLLEYASGRKPLARGMVLGALTRSDTQFPVTAQLADALRLPLDFSPSPRSVRERRSSQLAWYLDAEAPPPRPEPEWVPREVDEDDIEAEAEELEGVASEGEEGAEATSGVEGTEATQDAERSDEDSDSDSDSEGAEEAAERAPWTGWRVYDPPMYEDSVAPSPAEPFPAPRPAEVWRGLVLKDMDDDAPSSTATTASTNSEVDAELDAEEREEEMSAGVAAAGQGKMSKSMRRRAKERAKEAERLAAEERVAERALRAIRVPDALSVREAAALFELWLDSGVLRTGACFFFFYVFIECAG